MPKTRRLKRISLDAAEAQVKLVEGRYINQDPVKRGIEPNIRPVVVALVAHGFPTQNSCEGHLASNLYPWVRFQPMTTSTSRRALLQYLSQVHREAETLG